MPALSRSRIRSLIVAALLLTALAAVVTHWLSPNAAAPDAAGARVSIALASADFGPSLRRPVTAVRAHDTAPLPMLQTLAPGLKAHVLIVTRDGDRVGFASTKLRFVD